MAANKFRLALVQLAVGACKADNLTRASRLIGEAAKEGAQVVVLPECCNSPYGNDYFPEYAESIPGDSTKIFAQAAKDNNVHLVAGTIPERSKGTIPERDGDKIYNTCTVFNPNGSLVAKYRKLHLFDIDVPGKITFQESKTLTAGDNFATVDLGFCNIGIGICYDIRFPEVAKIYADKGCQLLLYPGAFNMTTGPAHWELLQRGRAIDNQLFVATVSPARDESAKYHAWGHSTVVDPWGTVIATTEHEETIVYADIDLDYMKQVREQIPTSKQKRNDMYTQVKLANM